MSALSEYQNQQLRLLQYKDEFQGGLRRIRKVMNLPENGLNSPDSYKDWASDNESLNVEASVTEFIEEMDLPHNFFLPVYSCILFNYYDDNLFGRGISTLFHSSNPRVFSETNTKTGKQRVFMEIYADTTLRDVKNIWKSHVEVDQPRMSGHRRAERRKPSPNFERDERVYLLAEQGISHQKIAEIISEEFDQVILYNQIAKIVDAFRKKITDM